MMEKRCVAGQIASLDSKDCPLKEVGAMQKLELLLIAKCPMLQNVPDGIENVMSLKKLDLYDMPSSLQKV